MNTTPHTKRNPSGGFTLLEILIVLMLIAFMMAAFGVTVANMIEKAREAQTLATIRKIDGQVTDRMEAIERFYSRPAFRRIIKNRHDQLRNVIPGISRKTVEIISRKQMAKLYLPQSFGDFIIAGVLVPEMGIAADRTDHTLAGQPDGIPDIFQTDVEDQNGNGVLDPGEDGNSNGVMDGFVRSNHRPETESAEMLYFALTQLDVFGTPPIGDSDFSSAEIVDTDNDNLPEFVDGWSQPLRFYRWPTRLLKAGGLFGADGMPGTDGVDDDGDGNTDTLNIGGITVPDAKEIGWVGTDDVFIDPDFRIQAGSVFSGLPRAPFVAGQYDLLNQDPDDPYGLLVSQSQIIAESGIPMFAHINETLYHTFDTFHKPLILSVGADGENGLFEPTTYPEIDYDGSGDLSLFGSAFTFEDANRNGTRDLLTEDRDGNGSLSVIQTPFGPLNEDVNGNGQIDFAFGNLAMPRGPSIEFNPYIADDITNRNRQAGGGN